MIVFVYQIVFVATLLALYERYLRHLRTVILKKFPDANANELNLNPRKWAHERKGIRRGVRWYHTSADLGRTAFVGSFFVFFPLSFFLGHYSEPLLINLLGEGVRDTCLTNWSLCFDEGYRRQGSVLSHSLQ